MKPGDNTTSTARSATSPCSTTAPDTSPVATREKSGATSNGGRHPTQRRTGPPGTLEQEVAEELKRIGLPPKPDYGEPCNHCGLCCTLVLCHVGSEAFPGAPAPCPALIQHEGKALCAMVGIEQRAGGPRLIQATLAIGMGCTMHDETTGDADREKISELVKAAYPEEINILIYGRSS